MTFDELLIQWNWKPIRNCPGRFMLAGVRPDLPPEAVVGPATELLEFTLNNAEAFSRKILQLGIVLDDLQRNMQDARTGTETRK